MDGLRWLLLLFGALLVLGVYLYSRRERKQSEQQPAAAELLQERVEPSLSAAYDAEEEANADGDDATVDEPEQKIVTLRIVAPPNSSFAGDELVLSLRGIGMRHGKFGIFHRYDGNDESRIVFSAASLVEPGSFDLTNIKDQQIPGISLFMVLPGPVDGAQAFDLMMEAGT